MDKGQGDIIKKIQDATANRGRLVANFYNELEMIKDLKISKFTKEILEKYTPEYFWTMPSNESGKYHMPDENVPGGLVIHVKRVVKVANHIMTGLGWLGHRSNAVYPERQYDYDVVISACLLHDILKCGFKGRERKGRSGNVSTDEMHPYYVRCLIRLKKLKDTYMYRLPFFDDVMKAIEGHYGFWSVLPDSTNLKDAQSHAFVCYMADYLGSRNILELK